MCIRDSDSIFWEEFGGTAIEAATRMIPDKQMLEEAAAFAGTVQMCIRDRNKINNQTISILMRGQIPVQEAPDESAARRVEVRQAAPEQRQDIDVYKRQLAPTTAAIRSYPNVSGVSYRLTTGSGV